MFKISPLRDVKKDDFEKMFRYYYAGLGCDDDCGHLLKEYVFPDLLAGLIKIEILEVDGVSAGFVIYQTDEINNDWNVREGWGDIREIYVEKSYRRQGLGRFLLYTAEMKLRESGAKSAYCIPAEGAEPFFEACGYKKTEDYNLDLQMFIYEKLSLVNGCKA